MYKKVKVLYVIETINIGGAENLLLSTVKYLDRKRFIPIVIYLYKGVGGTLSRDFNKLDVMTIGPVFENTNLIFGINELVKKIKEVSADIIHTHLFYANVFGRIAGRLSGVKNIITSLHNPDYTYESNSSLKFKFRKIIDRLSGKFINKGFIAVSNAVKKDFERQMYFENIEVVYNGVDLSLFESKIDPSDLAKVRNELDIKSSEVILLNIGRLHKQKGQEYLIRALKKVKDKFGNVKLFIAGVGFSDIYLKKLTKDLGLSDSVIFLGKRSDIKLIIEISDIFLLPSLYEGFGIATIEAMALKKPVIVSNISGVDEIVTNNKDGILVAPKDEEMLYKEIIKLIEDRSLRQRLGENGYKTVNEKFNIGKNVKEIENIYTNLMECHG